ncbi:hypothetical protein [Cyclobacterium amurskyense]|jgi:hypothetical protein|uniref:DUF4168 domain-containing protein n=1 Tax=Cyclobacterium amurskyense TaxID=320787 RepID=A0A0H4PHB2_9BACT|nr:hypothetical protein [Cyclobacterium amurskyense]AKP53559.1 hypothetical protein CA2015_4210 [Cyclobacterium amurskyense]|tara:strand:+ start:439 stop:951 length:513 start_codon:yes stop_codon:yes gene_type:complete
MKKLFGLTFLIFGLIGFTAQAQDEAAEEITDEEIAKFAAMEDSVMAFYEQKNVELVSMIKDNEVIDGAGRYNEIKAAWDDEAKLAEIEITDDEKAAYEEILEFMGSLSTEVRELKIGLIKNDDVLGIATYNKVNKAMKANPEVKEKVDSLMAELKEKRTPDEDESASDNG